MDGIIQYISAHQWAQFLLIGIVGTAWVVLFRDLGRDVEPKLRKRRRM